MDNYQYIIASLPVPDKDVKPGDTSRSAELLAFIREHCSAKDNELSRLGRARFAVYKIAVRPGRRTDGNDLARLLIHSFV